LLRDYEILYIVRPELDEEQVHAAVGSVDKLIANLGGATVKTDVWGRRRLAYEVRHLREGQYVLTDFRIDPERVPEMEATLKISETVFRHLITRKPEKVGRTARKAAAAAVAAEAAREAAAEAAREAAAETAPQESEAENKELETVPATAAGKAEEAEEGE
jgi:small subunit ribosomal protein S6